jgi:uncharacterized protein
MSVARFRFYAELNDFLPVESRMKELARHFDVSGSVKDLIESFGVPHTEVDLVLINSESADFTSLVRDQDRVSVYPVFESLDISAASRVRPAPLRELRFVLDVHLGRLAAYLRMAGFDALYRNDASDAELARISVSERRVLLTRDRYLLMRTKVNRGYWVRSTDARKQVVEVLERFDLADSMRPFTRCMKCNSPLEETSVESVLNRLPPGAACKGGIRRCSGCNSVYWNGSHHARMERFLGWVRANASGSPDQSVAREKDGLRADD